jgi:hypothetical protein
MRYCMMVAGRHSGTGAGPPSVRAVPKPIVEVFGRKPVATLLLLLDIVENGSPNASYHAASWCIPALVEREDWGDSAVMLKAPLGWDELQRRWLILRDSPRKRAWRDCQAKIEKFREEEAAE